MRKIKGLYLLLFFLGLGLSMAFSHPASAAPVTGKIYFHVNLPDAQFDKTSLLTTSSNKDLAKDDEFYQTLVVRTMKDRNKGKVGKTPAKIGKPGYILRNVEWNTSPTQGGTLKKEEDFVNGSFNDLFGRWQANEQHVYLLWKPKLNETLDLTYDSNSDGEVANPKDRKNMVAAGTFTEDDLPTLERHGYSFESWYSSKTGNKVATSKKDDSSAKVTPVEADPSIYNGTDETASLIATNLPLTAHWQKKTGGVQVVLLDPDGTEYRVIDETDIWTSLSDLDIVNPQKDGFRFTGWKTPDGEIVSSNEHRALASLDIKLSPGKTLKLYAQWAPQFKMTIDYKNRELNPLGIPSLSEMFDTGADWIWKSSYNQPIMDKVLAAYRLNNGGVVEGKPSTIKMTQDTQLDLIYGQDKAGSHGSPGSDGKEDFDVERCWQLEDGSPVSPALASEVVAWNDGETFDEDYDYGCDTSKLKGLQYMGFYTIHERGTLHTDKPNVIIHSKEQIIYVFHKITYDLKVHSINIDGSFLSLDSKNFPKELADSQDYFIDPTRLDDFKGKAVTGWYYGLPNGTAPSLSTLYALSKPLNVSEKGKAEVDITLVYDDVLNVTLPLSMKFVVNSSAAKSVLSHSYVLKNNSTSSKLLLKMDPTDDIKVDKNPAGIHLISSPRTDSASAEELYLTLKSNLSSFGEQVLSADASKITGELKAGESMNLTLAGKYYGELPKGKNPNKEFEGKLTWHFTAKPNE
ncbi:MAG: InlB B-repeat-containing protein [Streptococcaceae bacterium]|jgi:uncharacterized repeat protein (TIGR02543 family)|nr:InlB B-repeat-containing protein [Streptococcaceae bacterium]